MIEIWIQSNPRRSYAIKLISPDTGRIVSSSSSLAGSASSAFPLMTNQLHLRQLLRQVSAQRF
jgi:hypothetical protein